MIYSSISQMSVLGLDAIETPVKIKKKMQIWEPHAWSARSELRGQGLEFSLSKSWLTSDSEPQPGGEKTNLIHTPHFTYVGWYPEQCI